MTGTNLDAYYPFDAGAGANVIEAQWRTIAEQWFPTGIVAGYANEFAVAQRAAGANMSVDVATGQCRIKGHYGESTSIKNLGISANVSGNPRVDLIVLRADFVNNLVVVDVLTGTAAANPVEPAVTQNTSMWEIPLAAIDVAAAAVSIATANIRDRRFKVRELIQAPQKYPVRFATTAALAASTATATTRVANANGALGTIDSGTPVAGDRILDKDHATTQHRGIWQVVDPGSASTPWRLERPADANTADTLYAGLWVVATEGTLLHDTGWLLTTDAPIVVGTTGLTFTQFPGASVTTVKVVIPHTWVWPTAVNVPSGVTDAQGYMFPWDSAGTNPPTAVRIVGWRGIVGSGTSATVKFQTSTGPTDVTGFTGLSVTTAVSSGNPTPQAIATALGIRPVVTAVTSSPTLMSVTALIEYTFTLS